MPVCEPVCLLGGVSTDHLSDCTHPTVKKHTCASPHARLSGSGCVISAHRQAQIVNPNESVKSDKKLCLVTSHFLVPPWKTAIQISLPVTATPELVVFTAI